MLQTRTRKIDFRRIDSVEEFVHEHGWDVQSLHEKYLGEKEVKTPQD